jgi:type IV secretion system protein VirB8
MKKSEREALDAYYVEAGSWAASTDDAARRSKRVAWIVAGIATTVALFEAAALMTLTPLKTVVPYTLLVDRTTGFVQELQPLDAERITPDTALTQSFLAQYVIARESFDIDELQSNYRKVSLWSTGGARSSYINSVQASNPDSPLARYPRSTTVETWVNSVTALNNKSSLVRYTTVKRDEGGQLGAPRHWVSVIRYRFSQQPLQAEDRLINPLGFQVERYRRNQETLPDVEPAALMSPDGTVDGAVQQSPPAIGVLDRPASPQASGRRTQIEFGAAPVDTGREWAPRRGDSQ